MTDTTGAEGVDTLKHFECLKFDDYTLDLTGPNAALILADDQGTDEDNATTFSIEAWDFDGGTPTITSISVTGDGSVSATATGALSQGMGTGTSFEVSYDPSGAYETLAVGQSTTETITIEVDDGQGNTSVKNITITIDGVNDDPTLGAGVMTATEDGAVEVLDLSALGNDIDNDDDGSTLTYTVTGNPAEGSASIAGTALAFNPGADFQDLAVGETRDVVVEVTATDQHGASAVNAVTVTVTGTNDAPTLAAAAAGAIEDGASVDVDLAALGGDVDSDDDGTTLTYTVSGNPSEGSVSISGTTLTFDPGSDFQDLNVGQTRDVTVQVTATDAHGATAVNNVTVTVTGTNDAPVALNDEAYATETEAAGAPPAGFHFNAANGHSYRFVSSPATFAQASAAAASMGGHLATVTSAQENAFIYGLTGGAWAWLGGKDDAAEGVWRWTEGPEAGQQFWQGNVWGYAPNGAYENWNPTWWGGNSEPNNAGGHEDGVHMWGGGYWNDIPLWAGLGYVVEISSPNPIVSGSVASNDSDIDNGAILSFTLDAAVAGLTMNADGSWDFDSSDPAYDYLAEGEVAPVIANYTVTDEHGATDTATLTIHVTGTNDAPTASVIIAPNTNEDAGVVGINLLSTASDVDASDDLDVDAVSVSSSDGRAVAYSVDTETGAFSLDPSQFNDFAAGESATVTVSYNVVDGNGGSVANSAQFVVQGRNDAPTATGDSGAVTEDNTLVASGTISVSDPDTSDTHSFAVQGGGAGTYGSLAVDGNGDWTYTLNNGAANVQALAQGQTVYENFTVNVDDGNGGTTTAPVQIAVSGTNDAPVAQDVTLEANQLGNGGFEATPDFFGWTVDTSLTNASHPFASTYYYSTAEVDRSGLLGGDDAVAELSFGAQVPTRYGTGFGPSITSDAFHGSAGDTVTFEYQLSSGGDYAVGTAYIRDASTGAVVQEVFNYQTPFTGSTGAQQVDVVLNQSGEFTIDFRVGSYDATGGYYIGATMLIGTAGIVRNGVQEGDTQTFEAIQFLDSATDVDNGATISLHSVDATSALGASVSIDGAGNVFYDASGITHLGAGESAVDSFTYWVTDEHGALAQAEASITVNGVNDDPTATGGTGSVTEDGTLVANGSITVNDPDANDTHSFSIQGGGAGTYGTMSVDANGNWTYNLNNGAANVQALNSGDAVVDSFVFNVDDGNGGVTTANVDVTVNGADDNSFDELHVLNFDDGHVIGSSGSNTAYYGVFAVTGSGSSYSSNWGFYPYNYDSTDADNEAYNGYGPTFMNIALASGEDFEFRSGSFADGAWEGFWATANNLIVRGFNDGVEIYSETLILDKNDHQVTQFDYVGIDELVFEISGGSYTNGTGWYSVDDLTFYI